MRVTTLFQYPVKSLGGNAVTSLRPLERGFADDRRWMFIDANGQFISQRSNPALARFRAATVGGEGLEISEISSSKTVLTISRARPQAPADLRVTVWDDTFLATEVTHPQIPAAATAIGIPGARLVYMNGTSRRPVDPTRARHGETVSFADGYPYLIVGTASLADLSRRTEEELDVRRFRPNILVATTEPFVEDNWREVSVGSHQFYLPKPCARCIMVTHAPETGERNLRVMAELSAYRRVGRKVLFGVNALWESGTGVITVGDSVVVNTKSTT